MLEKILEGKKVLLASKSPRRHYLLKELGVDFVVEDLGEVEEVFPEDMNPLEVPVYLSELKSKALQRELADNELLITSDTIVLLNGKVIGKPRDRQDAENMLKELSDNKHTVITGVTFRSSQKMHSFDAVTDVHFKPLSENEINYYLDTYKPYDKAGAYGIQEWIGYIGVEKIDGSYFNVMGLPIQKVYGEIIDFFK